MELGILAVATRRERTGAVTTEARNSRRHHDRRSHYRCRHNSTGELRGSGTMHVVGMAVGSVRAIRGRGIAAGSLRAVDRGMTIPSDP